MEEAWTAGHRHLHAFVETLIFKKTLDALFRPPMHLGWWIPEQLIAFPVQAMSGQMDYPILERAEREYYHFPVEHQEGELEDPEEFLEPQENREDL